MLQPLAREVVRPAAQEEPARVRGRPDQVGDALETEHRIENQEGMYAGWRAAGCDELREGSGPPSTRPSCRLLV